jgi:cell division septation protein DedD
MVDKKPEEKKGKDPFSDSSEIFERIFKEATSEIQKEKGKVVARPGLKPKPKPESKPKLEARPKAPTKLELEPKEEEESKAAPLQDKPRSEQKPELQPPMFRPMKDPVRRPVEKASGIDGEDAGQDLLSTHPIMRSRVQEQRSKDEAGGEFKKPKLPRKKGKGSPVLRNILLLVLLAVGVGGASVYFGIIDLSDYIGGPEPAKKASPKVAATKTSPAQPAAKAPPPSPKPAEPVTPPPVKEAQAPPTSLAGAPPKPPEAQPKPETPAPPAVAKTETPPAPVQSPERVEPPPAPVQPPVVSQPQAPQPTPPPAPPAPVQQPAVPKKAETPQSGTQPKEVAVAKTTPPASGASYPYSVYLGSFQNLEYLKKALSVYENQGLSSYWTKVELGTKGTWYRVFTGHFRSAQEAEAFIQQKKIKDGEVRAMRYTNLIGTFESRQGGEEKARALVGMGLSAYWIQFGEGQVRLCSGAFVNKEDAEKNRAELNSKGIKSEIVER